MPHRHLGLGWKVRPYPSERDRLKAWCSSDSYVENCTGDPDKVTCAECMKAFARGEPVVTEDYEENHDQAVAR